MAGRVRLTKRIVDNLKAPAKGERWVMDSEVPRFGVRLRSTGAITYGLRFRFNGRAHKDAIGDVKSITLDDARAAARDRLGMVAKGVSPVQERRRLAVEGVTVKELGEDTLEALREAKRSPRHIRDFENAFTRYIAPAIGNMRMSDVTRGDLDRLVRSFTGQPALGNRLRAILSRAFKLAVREGYRRDDPSVGLQRFQERPRMRVYTETELQAILDDLSRSPEQTSADAVRLLLLTGSRPKEVFTATWDQFDLEAGVWTKPSQHTKAKREHRVELHPVAIALLKRRRPADYDPTEYVFLSRDRHGFLRKGKYRHITSVKRLWEGVRKRTGLRDANLYDLRKSFASYLMRQGAPLSAVMELTGHTQPTTLLRHYAMALPGMQRKAVSGVFGKGVVSMIAPRPKRRRQVSPKS